MPDFTVTRHGIDSSGRGIYASAYMWDWWIGVVDALTFTPTITQGAWMTLNGGGASDSAGYHDGGGCFDLRVWDLTDKQVSTLIRTIRAHGAAAWLRNPQHGGFTDPHIHLVLGTDADLDDGAAYQWRDYIAGGDGMGGRDYHPRPNPLVLTPPEVDDMPYTEKQLSDIAEAAAAAAVKAATPAIVEALLDTELGNGDTVRNNLRRAGDTKQIAQDVAKALNARRSET
jgi:hypothetical protein